MTARSSLLPLVLCFAGPTFALQDSPARSRFLWADINADGRVDAFVLRPDGSGRLLVGLENGDFEDRTLALGLGELGSLRAAAWGDMQGDGRLELAVVEATGRARLFLAEGQSVFSDVTSRVGLPVRSDVTAAEWLDYDGDGADDLLWHTAREELLFRNNRAGLFDNVQLGLERLVAPVLAESATERMTEAESGEVALDPSSGRAAPGADAGHSGPGRGAERIRGMESGSDDPGTNPARTLRDNDLDNVSSAVNPPFSSQTSCFPTMLDQATGNCIRASSIPELGLLYPLGIELFIDAASQYVGIGTLTPLSPLHVEGGAQMGTGHTVAAPLSSVLAGSENTIATDHSAIASGQRNVIEELPGGDASHNFIAGGWENRIETDSIFSMVGVTGQGSSIGGGMRNTVRTSRSVIGGGHLNEIEASGSGSVIAGGEFNIAAGTFSVVGGGKFNAATGGSSAVAGGLGNRTTGSIATIAGGVSNEAAGSTSTIGGGQSNLAPGTSATVAGGSNNEAAGVGSTIGGGEVNLAAAKHATVAGGSLNEASGEHSSIPGGRFNIAGGSHSFAAGHRAEALHDGAFVFANDTAVAAPFASTGAHQFLIRATGGVGIGTATPSSSLTVHEPDESASKTDFTESLTRSGLNITTEYTGDTYAPGLFWSTDNNNASKPKAGIFMHQASNGSRLHFGTSDAYATGITNDALIIDQAGKIGVGTGSGSIDAILHVQANSTRSAKFDRYGSDGELVAWARDDSVIGNVTVAGGTVSYNAFTGSHYAWSETEPEVGALMVLSGDNRPLSDGEAREIVYGVTPCTRANDRACLGAYVSTTRIGDGEDGTDVRLVAAVGNGELWVVDTGVDIAPGDYLIASDITGCAMLDDPRRFDTGHIVARAAEAVNWEALEDGARRARISVLFDPFERGPDNGGQNEALQEQIAELKIRIAELAR